MIVERAASPLFPEAASGSTNVASVALTGITPIGLTTLEAAVHLNREISCDCGFNIKEW